MASERDENSNSTPVNNLRLRKAVAHADQTEELSTQRLFEDKNVEDLSRSLESEESAELAKDAVVFQQIALARIQAKAQV